MSKRMKKAIILMAVCLLAGLVAWHVMGWDAYVKGWVGVHFKLTSGGVLGWLLGRYGLSIDLSTISDPIQKGFAGLSLAIMVSLFALGAAMGV